MNGIEKDMDNLGRVVIPIKFRKKLGIEDNSTVLVSLEDNAILISPANKCCVLCGKKVEDEQKFRLCQSCIAEIKSDN
ncbi:MAG: AbrB/MazE/SpoVT family DNA-binding domain-containing protein [Clostridia bacterium]|nr:AbrB/MazE/SpoVT family DNA-binding domain-containing protein [Clostridia bacterium]